MRKFRLSKGMSQKNLTDRKDMEKWNSRNWMRIHQKVKAMQHNLVRAEIDLTLEGHKKESKIKIIQLDLMNSFEARAIAVRRVVTSSGGTTPGIDGTIRNTSAKRFQMTRQRKKIVEHPQKYRASPLKRVMIPKKNTEEMRPLGIPTIKDRAVQALYHLSIDPIVETRSDPRSFGFRKGRSCRDAIRYRQLVRNGKSGARYVMETDVEKCFDKISHDFLRQNTPICHTNILDQWLKAGVWYKGNLEPTREGTPQGGVISPRLCNVALNGMEDAVILKVLEHTQSQSRPKRWKNKVRVVRYADDVVVTAATDERLVVARAALDHFLKERGLQRKEKKTRMLHIREGFEFLGFKLIRKSKMSHLNSGGHGDVILISPTSQAIEKIKKEIKGLVRPNYDLDVIAKKLNPILRGWVNYYAITWTCFSGIQKVNQYLFVRLYQRQRKGPKIGNRTKAFEKVIRTNERVKWKWGSIMWPSDVKIQQHLVVKLDINPYLVENEGYIRKRSRQPQLGLRAKRYDKYKQRCSYCGEPLRNGEPVEIHHIVAKKDGGSDKMKNLQPLHRLCHQARTHSQNRESK